MSTTQNLPAPEVDEDFDPRSPEDPFFYGFRDVQVLQPDGSYDVEQIPLTEEDVLHPRFGDKIVLGLPHSVDCTYLHGLLRGKFSADPSVAILSDQGIFWDNRKLRHHAPDIAVIFGVRRQMGWKTFRIPREGTRPSLIIEITSIATRSTDLGKKVIQYAQARVPHYVVVDGAAEEDEPRLVELIEFRPGPTGAYERQPIRPDGRIWLEEVGLWLGKVPASYGERIACYDPETGEEIGDYGRITDDLKRAEAEAKAQAADARARIEEAEAEAINARAEADAAKARAEEEMRKRIDLEARLKAMEALLRQPPPSSNGSH